MSESLKAFLDSIPETLPPPEGIEVNYDAPNTNGTAYIVIAVIGIFLATLFTVVRIYTKAILTRSLGWDDCKDFSFSFFFFFLFFFIIIKIPRGRRRGGRGKGRGARIRDLIERLMYVLYEFF